jgi:hypothetical protein
VYDLYAFKATPSPGFHEFQKASRARQNEVGKYRLIDDIRVPDDVAGAQLISADHDGEVHLNWREGPEGKQHPDQSGQKMLVLIRFFLQNRFEQRVQPSGKLLQLGFKPMLIATISLLVQDLDDKCNP